MKTQSKHAHTHTQEHPTLKRIQVPTQWMLFYLQVPQRRLSLRLQIFESFSSCIPPSAVFFYSCDRSGFIYLPGNFATASPSNRRPSTLPVGTGRFFTTMLQNPRRNSMTVTQTPTAKVLKLSFSTLDCFSFLLFSCYHTLLFTHDKPSDPTGRIQKDRKQEVRSEGKMWKTKSRKTVCFYREGFLSLSLSILCLTL